MVPAASSLCIAVFQKLCLTIQLVSFFTTALSPFQVRSACLARRGDTPLSYFFREVVAKVVHTMHERKALIQIGSKEQPSPAMAAL